MQKILVNMFERNITQLCKNRALTARHSQKIGGGGAPYNSQNRTGQIGCHMPSTHVPCCWTTGQRGPWHYVLQQNQRVMTWFNLVFHNDQVKFPFLSVLDAGSAATQSLGAPCSCLGTGRVLANEIGFGNQNWRRPAASRSCVIRSWKRSGLSLLVDDFL